MARSRGARLTCWLPSAKLAEKEEAGGRPRRQSDSRSWSRRRRESEESSDAVPPDVPRPDRGALRHLTSEDNRRESVSASVCVCVCVSVRVCVFFQTDGMDAKLLVMCREGDNRIRGLTAVQASLIIRCSLSVTQWRGQSLGCAILIGCSMSDL